MSEQIDLPHTGLGLRSAGLAFGGTPAQRSLGFSLKPRVTQRYSGRGLCRSTTAFVSFMRPRRWAVCSWRY